MLTDRCSSKICWTGMVGFQLSKVMSSRDNSCWLKMSQTNKQSKQKQQQKKQYNHSFHAQFRCDYHFAWASASYLNSFRPFTNSEASFFDLRNLNYPAPLFPFQGGRQETITFILGNIVSVNWFVLLFSMSLSAVFSHSFFFLFF